MTRVAVVTGGTRGIGEAISVALKGLGYTVIANYAGNEAKARAFTEETGIPAARWDVGDHEATLAGCAAIEAEHGPIDIVVNNAGVTRDGVLHKMSWEDWNEVMRVNLGGCFNMAKATFPGMRARGWGRIVNIGSVNGQSGQYGQVNYAAAKSGIHGFTKALAQEGAKFGVTVNAIAPGYIPTWWRRCRRRCWKRSSRRSRWAGWARPARLRAGWRFCAARRRRLSPDRR